MARVTVEDCLLHIPNHFDLCQVAVKRARQLGRGAPAHLSPGDRKCTVQALREVAAGHVGFEVLETDDLPLIKDSDRRIDLPELEADI